MMKFSNKIAEIFVALFAILFIPQGSWALTKTYAFTGSTKTNSQTTGGSDMNFQSGEDTTWILSDATYGSDLSFGVGYSNAAFMGATLTSVDEFHMVSKIILSINLNEEAIQFANPRWVKFSCNQTENQVDITTLNIDPEGVVLEMKNYTPNGPLRINVEGYGYEITLNSITVEYNKEVWHELQFNGSSPLIINWNERNTAQFLDLGYRDPNNAFIPLSAAELTEIRFTSSDESVATISNDGSITILKPGSTTIDANYPGNTRYYGQEAWYTLTVNDSENQLFGGGNGTYEAPYLISTPADLKALSTYVNTGVLDTERKYFYLSKDLDCSALTGFEPIGNATYPFKGLFAANYLYYDHDSVEDNHKITGLTCLSDDQSADVGLFGVVDKVGDFYCGPAYVRLENCTFGGGARNGAMVGYLSNGTIYCCTVVSCTIRSGNARNPQSGGMAGAMNDGRIANVSVHSSTITASTTGSGTADAGGLVGHIDGGEFLSNFSDNNTVISTTGGSTAYAGAFIGNISNNASGTFDSTYRSFYSYGATQTKIASDAEPQIKTGQTPRAIGNGNDILGTIQMDFVKKITIISGINGRVAPKEGTYYMMEGVTCYVLDNEYVTFQAAANDNNRPSLTLSDESITVTSEDVYENGAYSYTEFTFKMPNADVTATFVFGNEPDIRRYSLWIDNTQVTEENQNNILKDAGACFQYFPDLNKLFITNSTGGQRIESRMPEGLIIYLAPNSNNKVKEIVSTTAAPLTITTDGNYPGRLTLEAAYSNVIDGFSALNLEENLAILDTENVEYRNNVLEARKATIGIVIEPIVQEEIESFDNPELNDNSLENYVYDNKVLITLNDTENPDGDGFDDSGTPGIVLNNVVTDDTFNLLDMDDSAPGTQKYADTFTGLTILVPGGEGWIVIDAETHDGYCIKLRSLFGEDLEAKMTTNGVRTKQAFHYEFDEPTFVGIYNGGLLEIAARGKVIRPGKKTVTHIKVFHATISPGKVNASNPAGAASGGLYTGPVPAVGQDVDNPTEIESGIVSVTLNDKGQRINDKWYNLNGQQINEPCMKGLYIHNRQKKYIK